MSLFRNPLEEHTFTGSPNDFLCSRCGRPRAMHLRYPFHPKRDPIALGLGWSPVTLPAPSRRQIRLRR